MFLDHGPPTRGHTRTFTRTVNSSNRQRPDNDREEGQRRQNDRPSNYQRRGGEFNRRKQDSDGPRPTGEFRNLNDAQPLPKREPRNQPRRQNGNQREQESHQQSQNRYEPGESQFGSSPVGIKSFLCWRLSKICRDKEEISKLLNWFCWHSILENCL